VDGGAHGGARRQVVGLVLGAVMFLAPLLVDVPGLEDMGERVVLSGSSARAGSTQVDQ